MGILARLVRQTFSRGQHAPLLILDQAYPSPLSAYRYAEFTHYLETLPETLVLTTLPPFEKHHAALTTHHPAIAPRVRRFDPSAPLPQAGLVYTVFLNTALHFLPYIERQQLPLAMTLYPGGDFGFNDANSDAMLERLFDYPHLRKVIATQPATVEYLKSRGHYRPDVVTLMYGAVIPKTFFTPPPPRLRFGAGKPTLDLCFVAYKYMPQGRDKGYDTFIAAAHEIARQAPEARFHVVGNYTPEDIDVSALGSAIQFHGIKLTPDFPAFYAGMDLIVSPNVPHLLGGGKTDGFPTAACVEASLSGVGLMCSDVMKQNAVYRDGEEICVVAPETATVTERILHYRAHPTKLAALGERGRARSLELFDPEVQLGERTALLRQLLRR
jgi:lipopolysaccharide transport system ATP-binding protein